QYARRAEQGDGRLGLDRRLAELRAAARRAGAREAAARPVGPASGRRGPVNLRYPRPPILEKICQGGRPPRHVVIEASAGTGKTYTLEHAVIELLLDGIPVEKLLVVTFTDRATYELRDRVRKLPAGGVAGRLPDGAPAKPDHS